MIFIFALLACAQDWPQFRGPDGQGHADVQKLPLQWGDATPNIAWRADIDGLGWSSPSIADGRIWLTTATEGGLSLRVLALDEKSGKILVNVEVFRLAAPGPIHKKNSHASPTPLVEGDRVYVHFGSNGTACLGTKGEIVWKETLKYAPVHGSGGSPALLGDLLFIPCDGADAPRLVAIDKKSGKLRWSAPRPELPIGKKFSFCTPLVIDVKGKKQVVSPFAGGVSAYDPATGKAIWTVRYGDGYSVVPRPVYGDGLLFLSSGYDKAVLLAIRPDGAGDVTDTHVVWKTDKNAPNSPSPLLVGDELYVVSDNSIASCLDAKTGTVHWRERLVGNFSASPLFAAGRIYFLDEDGVTTVVKADKTFTRLGRNAIKGRTLASLAPVEGALFLRTDKQLLRINAE